jgi:RNA polymerase sigma-70 factor, ECF subfamily
VVYGFAWVALTSYVQHNYFCFSFISYSGMCISPASGIFISVVCQRKRERKEPFVDKIPAAEAVEALIHEYGKLVFHTIYGLIGDWEESQDLTQDAFHQALRSIDAARAKSGSQFRAKPWLLQIALNIVRMQRRRRSIFRFIPFSSMQKNPAESEGAVQPADADELNERAAAVQPAGYGASESVDPGAFIAEQDAVQRTLAHLTEPLRVCLLLSIVGQFSTNEIAQMLVIEEATVRQRLARARKLFQNYYALESGEEVIDKAASTIETHMSQNHPAKHHNNIERVESRRSTATSQP